MVHINTGKGECILYHTYVEHLHSGLGGMNSVQCISTAPKCGWEVTLFNELGICPLLDWAPPFCQKPLLHGHLGYIHMPMGMRKIS